MLLRMAFGGLLVACAGCATITRGTTQAITLSTPGVNGASCELSSPKLGKRTVVTPANITLEKDSHAITVQCSKECFHPGVGVVGTEFEPMVAGNILVGGLVGMGIDYASGAMSRYIQETSIVMSPIEGCRSRIAQKGAPAS